jgi:phytoene dehydrogenase-like protein
VAAYDAVVVGSGPNGLSAAVALAQAGLRVLVREGAERMGGGARTLELTLPGFLHDHCSAIHPLGAGSPFFRRLALGDHGLEWVVPPAAVAHPFDDGTAAVLFPSFRDTGETLGPDARAWRSLLGPLADRWWDLADATLGTLLRVPPHPLLLARFGVEALLPAAALARARFRGARARALFAGLAAHAAAPLDRPPTAAFGLVLGAAGHAVNWPFPRGGSRRIPEALAAILSSHGGVIETGAWVRSLADLPPARATLLDLTPRQIVAVAADRLPAPYRRQLSEFRYGPGVCKIDWALAGPIPWTARECALAATVHLGGTMEEIAASSEAVESGRPDPRPFVILAQQTLFDPSRAPPGRHTAWAYCHLPRGIHADATAVIEAQIERFAPGFHDLVLARAVRGPSELERENPNLVEGDVGAGENTFAQTLFRPVPRLSPWTTPVRGLYICSAATPPGGGVHGMCGFHAARAVLRRLRGEPFARRRAGEVEAAVTHSDDAARFD